LAACALAGLLMAHQAGPAARAAAQPGAEPPVTAGPPKPAPDAPSSSPSAEQPAPASVPAAPPGEAAAQPVGAGESEQEAILFMKDGQRFSGLLVEQTDAQIVLRIAGIKTTFKREAIDRLRVLPPIDERYRQTRAAIEDNDAEQLLRLADWLIERRRYELAGTELEALAKRQPQNQAVLRKRDMVRRFMELRDRARPEARPAGASPKAAPEPAPLPAGSMESFPYLNEASISLMKVYEIDLARSPRVVIPPEAITALLERYADHPAMPTTREGKDALFRRNPVEVLDLMFRVRARDLYPMVKVIDQPEPVRAFRDDVLRGWLLNACAANSCHGGLEAGRLVLSNRAPGSDATVYTNLLILDRFRLQNGQALINWEEPARSPLLQMGLERDESIHRHPPVLRGAGEGRDAWRSAFRNADDPRFQATIAWIKQMYRPRSEYPVEYTPIRPFKPSQPQAQPDAR
jgi:hypothetical protein